MSTKALPVLEYLCKLREEKLGPSDTTYFRYPTAISRTLHIGIVDAGLGTATVEIATDPAIHGNQQGTIHGGLLCELADAAIGTAHSTFLQQGESFTTIELKMNFFRPVWKDNLKAVARPVKSGRTITHYQCEVIRQDGKVAALCSSIVMTLRGKDAKGR